METVFDIQDVKQAIKRGALGLLTEGLDETREHRIRHKAGAIIRAMCSIRMEAMF